MSEDRVQSKADEAARRVTRGVARGEPGAVAEFYETWFDFALRLASRASRRDESFCLDVVQDAMIRVARSMPALDSRAAVERWLQRTVYSVVIDHVRAEQRRIAREQAAGLLINGNEDTDDDAMEWVRKQLRSLQAEDALLVRLRFAGAMKLRAMGLALGTTSDAVRGRLRCLLTDLRDAGGSRDEG